MARAQIPGLLEFETPAGLVTALSERRRIGLGSHHPPALVEHHLAAVAHADSAGV